MEYLKNTEVLDGLKERFIKTKNRLQNPSLKIIREVEPTDDEFKGVQNCIKEIVSQNFPKERGSNHLLTTVQGLYIVSENETEEKKISKLENGLRSYELRDTIPLREPNTPELDTLFSDNPRFQNIRFNSDFNTSCPLNNLNRYVTRFSLTDLDYGQSKYDYVDRKYYSGTPNDASFGFLEDGDWFNYANYYGRDENNTYWNILTDILDVDERIIEIDDYETSVERINSIDPIYLFKNLSKVNSQLDAVDTQIDAFKDATSVTYSTFCEIFPDVDAFLEIELEKDEEEIMRKSQLKRKTVKFAVTEVFEIEMDIADDEDTESLISEKYLKMKGSKYLSGDLFSDHFGMDDYVKQISSKFDGVSLIEVMDADSDMEEVA
jgi:hypothetical protein